MNTNSVEEAKSTIGDVLKWDPRAVYLRKNADFKASSNRRFIFALDAIDVCSSFEGTVATVTEV